MKASEAFNNVCSLVSEKYKDKGWKYSKSGHWMTIKDKKFMYKVFFYTSWKAKEIVFLVRENLN